MIPFILAWYATMYQFKRLDNYELIRQTMTNPKIYRWLVDDNCPAREAYTPIESDLIWYVGVYKEDTYLGLWMFTPQNSVCWEVHTCLLPAAWGESAQAGKEMVDWLWANTPCQRIITNVPVFNKLALILARNCGFIEFGRNIKSFLRNSVLHDQVLLGLSKGGN